VPNLLSGPAAGPPVDVDDKLVSWKWDGTYTVEDDTWGLGGFALLSVSPQKLEVEYFDENGDSRRKEVMGPASTAQA
jgi:hypothetical protein